METEQEKKQRRIRAERYMKEKEEEKEYFRKYRLYVKI